MWPYYPQLLDKTVPRYTSYPTAAEFTPALDAAAQAQALAKVAPDARLSLYVHIPFCRSICWYCGCTTGAAGHAARRAAYVTALLQEIHMVGARLQGRGQLASIHFGGGSPNALPIADVTRIVHAVHQNFSAARYATLDMELDPRTLDAPYIEALGGLGLQRASLGVQTFAPHVQKAVHRIQPFEMIAQCCAQLRAAGVGALNFDLLYGLPHQSGADIENSIAQALSLAPARLAVFGYAHMPHIMARQRAIDTEALPSLKDRFTQSAMAYRLLGDAGYRAIGFDHFAQPQDPLAQAQAQGRLRRNFQGFTDDPSDVLIGLGASAISHFGDVIIQNEKMSGAYGQRIMSGQLAGTRGVRRTAEDMMRASIIENILCHGFADVQKITGYRDVWKNMSWEADALVAFIERDLVVCDANTVRLKAAALPYARSIASVFDAYRHHGGAAFSKAV